MGLSGHTGFGLSAYCRVLSPSHNTAHGMSIVWRARKSLARSTATKTGASQLSLLTLLSTALLPGSPICHMERVGGYIWWEKYSQGLIPLQKTPRYGSLLLCMQSWNTVASNSFKQRANNSGQEMLLLLRIVPWYLLQWNWPLAKIRTSRFLLQFPRNFTWLFFSSMKQCHSPLKML